MKFIDQLKQAYPQLAEELDKVTSPILQEENTEGLSSITALNSTFYFDRTPQGAAWWQETVYALATQELGEDFLCIMETELREKVDCRDLLDEIIEEMMGEGTTLIIMKPADL